MPRKNQIKTEGLSRFLIYVLGHRPDEFGLVPEPEGFVPTKELLQALHEEPGWGYVRQGHINEVLLGSDRGLFESEADRIRVLDRRWDLDLDHPAPVPPKILYVCVRRRAHPHALEKGLKSSEGRFLILSPDKETAERIGRRRDHAPVLFEVMTHPAQKAGVSFLPFGDLYLSAGIPKQWISGPPLPKDFEKKQEQKSEKQEKARPALEAGTLILDPDRDPAPHRQAKGRKSRGWKEDVRKTRRRK
ncbi:MAG: RNA 2'-phosphotransferase [Pseudomonadota bacterium]